MIENSKNWSYFTNIVKNVRVTAQLVTRYRKSFESIVSRNDIRCGYVTGAVLLNIDISRC